MKLGALMAAALLAVAGAAAGQQKISLSELVGETMEKNPDVAAASAAVRRFEVAIPRKSALPDPELSLSLMNFSLTADPTADPMSSKQVGIMQMIPLGGKPGLRGDIAAADLEMAKARLRRVKAAVASRLRKTFEDYLLSFKLDEIRLEEKRVLLSLKDVIAVAYSTGAATQYDALAARTEIALLEEKLTTVLAKRRAAAASINALSGRQPDATLPDPEEPPAEAVALDPEELRKAALSGNPMIEELRAMERKADIAAALARKSYWPDVSVGISYGQRDMMADVMSLEVRMPLPVFFEKKQDALVEEAGAGAAAIRAMIAAESIAVSERISRILARLDETGRNLANRRKAVIPLAEQSLEAAVASYRTARSDILAVLAAEKDLIMHREEAARLEAARRKLLADLDVELGRIPGEQP